jgi:hypothetical protein
MTWGTAVQTRSRVPFPSTHGVIMVVRGDVPRGRASADAELSTDLVKFSSAVDQPVDNSARRGSGLLEEAFCLRHFHCVETTKPAAMKPKPTTIFQLPIDSIGNLLAVT